MNSDWNRAADDPEAPDDHTDDFDPPAEPLPAWPFIAAAGVLCFLAGVMVGAWA